VRESFRYIQGGGEVHDFGVWYKANGEYKWWRDNAGRMNYPISEKNRPSIHMPRWASRITLEITEVRAERVQEIWIPDAIAEGCSLDFDMEHFGNYVDPISKFQDLWDSINFKRGYGWEKNPWVWCITFKVSL